MNERKCRLSLTSAIIILSIAILFSANQISNVIRDSSINSYNTGNNNYDYELSRFNDNFEELIKALQENDKNNE